MMNAADFSRPECKERNHAEARRRGDEPPGRQGARKVLRANARLELLAPWRLGGSIFSLRASAPPRANATALPRKRERKGSP